MISNDEVKNLANLARVALTLEEETKLAGELGQILDYVGELKNAGASEVGLPGEAPAQAGKLAKSGNNVNKLREDNNAEASLSDEEREKLLGGKFLKVKKIL